MSKVSNEATPEIKNKPFRRLQGCNNAGKIPVVFFRSLGLVVIRIREQNRLQCPGTI